MGDVSMLINYAQSLCHRARYHVTIFKYRLSVTNYTSHMCQPLTCVLLIISEYAYFLMNRVEQSRLMISLLNLIIVKCSRVCGSVLVT